jgi:sugar transferase EpsL
MQQPGKVCCSRYALDMAVKRMLDVILAAFSLAVLSPLLLVVALAVRMKLGAPVLFWQRRAGLNGLPFELAKFRSMAPATAGKADDAPRMGPFGRWLRSSSLDELPSLWNILRGDISIVGPRPLFDCYVPLYSHHQRRRLEVRPGLTGWAQINGRNLLTWAERFDMDVWYVDNRSLWLDMRIVWKTVAVVFSARGVNSDANFTMEPFAGTEENQSEKGSQAQRAN